MNTIITRRRSLLAVLFLLLAQGARAQTTLSPGSLVFTSYNAGPSSADADTFSFLLLAPISSNTTIFFTDKGYFSPTSAFNSATSTDGTVSWVTGTAIAAGTQITIVPPKTASPGGGVTPLHPGYAFLGTPGGTTNGTVTKVDGGAASGIGVSLGSNGDQLFAYQGTLTTSNLISGIHFNLCAGGTTSAAWDATSCASSVTPSQLPSTLSAGVSALYIPPTNGVASSQAVYSGTRGSASNPNAVRSNVYNSNNWAYNDGLNGELATPAAPFATPLPVSWLSFTGASRNGTIVLDWKVGEERQTAGYQIQRSENGEEFEAVGTQKVLGEGGAYEYRYTDTRVGDAPVYYYRLQSLEWSGEPQYSSTVRVINTVSIENSGIRLLHNPIGASLDLEVAAVAEGFARLVVTDLTGRTALQQEWSIRPGRQTVSCPTTGLQPDQIYLLTGTVDGKVWHTRVVR